MIFPFWGAGLLFKVVKNKGVRNYKVIVFSRFVRRRQGPDRGLVQSLRFGGRKPEGAAGREGMGYGGETTTVFAKTQNKTNKNPRCNNGPRALFEFKA